MAINKWLFQKVNLNANPKVVQFEMRSDTPNIYPIPLAFKTFLKIFSGEIMGLSRMVLM